MNLCTRVLLDSLLNLMTQSSMDQSVEGLVETSVYFGIPAERAFRQSDMRIGEIVWDIVHFCASKYNFDGIDARVVSHVRKQFIFPSLAD